MGWFWSSKNEQSVATETAPTPGGCPVKHVNKPESTTTAEGKCPIPHEQRSSWFSWGTKAAEAKKQEQHSSNDLNLNNMMPELSHQRMPGQQIPLPTQRTRSSIPRGVTEQEGVWEYPSPQQMFNAMVRKAGGSSNDIPEDAVESMVDVHNFLNEGAWDEILKWEEQYTQESGTQPRLLKFQGRPDEMSPRARMLQMLGKAYPSKYGMPPPFDRHDWTVLRSTTGDKSESVRYVIDYYAGPEDENDMPTFFLDVRPALDSVGGAIDRFQKFSGPVWDKAMGSSSGSKQ